MTAADPGPASGADERHPGAAGGRPKPLPAAAIALLAAVGKLLAGLRALAFAEMRAARAGIPLLFIGALALVALAVSLWVCLVALIGWALMHATHSLGLALGLLVVIHAVLVTGVWATIKYLLRQSTFPRARTELRVIGASLRHDLQRFSEPGVPPDPGPPHAGFEDGKP